MAQRADVRRGLPVVTSDGQRIGLVGEAADGGFRLEDSAYFAPAHVVDRGFVAVVEPEAVFLAHGLEPLLRAAAQTGTALADTPARHATAVVDEHGRVVEAPGARRRPVVTLREFDDYKNSH